MKCILLAFSLLFWVICFGQNDSLLVRFGIQSEQNCAVLRSATNKYRINSQEIQKISFLENTHFFAPRFINDFYSPRPDIRLEPYKFEGLTLNAYIDGISDQEPFRYDQNVWVPMKPDAAIEYVKKTFRDTLEWFQLYRNYTSYGFIRNTTSDWQLAKEQKEDSIKRWSEFSGNGIVDGVFLVPRDTYWRKVPYPNLHPEKWDSIQKQSDILRDQKYQVLVDSLLQPFYLANFEVTNKEYREFTNWVRDSIAREQLYSAVELDKDAAKMICNCRESFDNQNFDRSEIREKCNLNWKFKLDYHDPKYVAFLNSMYHPQPERFYKRPEYNTDKFIYRSKDIDSVKIYPDTAGFLSIPEFYGEVMRTSYFWHPAYDKYPVVNVSYDQIQAFIEWKEKEINKTLKKGRVEVRLPSLYHYEIATKFTFDFQNEWETIDLPNTAFRRQDREIKEYSHFLVDVDQKLHFFTKAKGAIPIEAERFHRWYHERFNPKFAFLTGNVSEIVADEVNQNKLDYYEINESFAGPSYFVLGENYSFQIDGKQVDSYNSVFYKQTLRHSESNPFSGFRLLYIYHEDEAR